MRSKTRDKLKQPSIIVRFFLNPPLLLRFPPSTEPEYPGSDRALAEFEVLLKGVYALRLKKGPQRAILFCLGHSERHVEQITQREQTPKKQRKAPANLISCNICFQGSQVLLHAHEDMGMYCTYVQRRRVWRVHLGLLPEARASLSFFILQSFCAPLTLYKVGGFGVGGPLRQLSASKSNFHFEDQAEEWIQ